MMVGTKRQTKIATMGKVKEIKQIMKDEIIKAVKE